MRHGDVDRQRASRASARGAVIPVLAIAPNCLGLQT